MLKQIHGILCAAVALCACMVARPANADFVFFDTLDNLVNLNESFAIGDKVFSNFTFSSSATGGAMAVDPSNVALSVNSLLRTELGEGPPENEFGAQLLFQSGSEFVVFTGQTQDTTIGFKVTSLGSPVEDAALSHTAASDGSGFVTTSSTITNVAGGLTVSTAGATDVESDLMPPTNTVFVSTNIHLEGGDGTFSFLSDLQHSFYESVDVPEPGSWLLLGTGLASFGGMFWFKRRKTALAA